MKNVYLFFATGFEEIEALTPVDILRRGGINVKTVGVGAKTVTGSHGVQVVADLDGQGFTLPEDAAMVVLPGGGLGTENLAESEMVSAAIQEAAKRKLYIGAICAAPTVLHKEGILGGKRVTAFPAVEEKLTGATYTGGPVEIDGNIITGRSAGVALQFAKTLLTALTGADKADEVMANLYPE